jgi:hypothetical protein
MDVVARGRRLLLKSALALAAPAAFWSCDRPPESPAGVSSGGAGGRARAAADASVTPSRELDLLPRDFRTRYGKLSAARFVSAGHAAGRFEVEVYANDLARQTYGRHTGTFPVGAVFVKEHFERTADAVTPGPLMAMQKMPAGYDAEHGDWRYVVVAPEGGVLSDGKPEGCVLCHDDAPHDRVFRIEAAK